MKVLFVCKSNAGRSQMAEAFFQKFSSKDVGSAGTNVSNEQKEGEPVPPMVIRIMTELGFDMSKHFRKPLTKEMFDNYDKVIFFTDNVVIPDYAKKDPKTVVWDVKDARNQDYAFHIRIRDQIKELVKELVDQVG